MLSLSLLAAVPIGTSLSAAAPVHDWLDLWGDGRLALYVRGGAEGGDRIWIPDTEGQLVESSELVGLASRPGAREAVVVDLDGDGANDLVRVDAIDGRLEALRFGSAGVFEDVTLRVGLGEVGAVAGLRALDYDADGKPDLEIAGEDTLVVYRNTGSVLERAMELELAAPPLVGAAATALDHDTTGTGAAEGTTSPGALVTTLGNLASDASALANATLDAAPERDPAVGGTSTVPGDADPQEASQLCANAILDQASGTCLTASSAPTLGSLYPLSTELNVSPAGTGQVGMGTTTPVGHVHVYDAGTPSGNASLLVDCDATTGTIYGTRVEVDSSEGTAVLGVANAATGSTTGLSGRSFSPDGRGVYGEGGAEGVVGISTTGYGVLGRGTIGVIGDTLDATGTIGVEGRCFTGGIGVRGLADTTGVVGIGDATGVSGEGVNGVVGNTTEPGGRGVFGTAATDNGIGVLGRTDSTGSGVGVQAESTPTGVGLVATVGSPGIVPDAGTAVHATSDSVAAGSAALVARSTATTGSHHGAIAISDSDVGAGLTASGGLFGVSASATSAGGAGVSGSGPFGVNGYSGYEDGTGVYGSAPGSIFLPGGTGVFGEGEIGVHGMASSTDGTGMRAEAEAGGVGLVATTGTPTAVPDAGNAIHASSDAADGSTVKVERPFVELTSSGHHNALEIALTGVRPDDFYPAVLAYDASGGGQTYFLNSTISAYASRDAASPASAAAFAAYVDGSGVGDGLVSWTEAFDPASVGVQADSTYGTGVRASGREEGVHGIHEFFDGRAVWGENRGTGTGVHGSASSPSAFGVFSDGDFGGSGAKYFVQPHPDDASKEIRFVCLEGNESGTYFRGSSQLVGGVAVLEVPEEFRLASEPDELTVQVTGAAPGMLWVDSKDLDSIVVRGEPDIEFDYFVNGVRRGFAGLEAIRENRALRPTWRGEPYGRQLPEEVRALLVRNGTLNPDFTPNEATATALGWRLRDRPDRSTHALQTPEGVVSDPAARQQR